MPEKLQLHIRTVRAFWYRVLGPLTAVLVIYGAMAEQTVALYAALVTGVINGLMAALNTSLKDPQSKLRAFAYWALTPLFAVLIAVGVVNEEQAATWAALVAAVLGGGLAVANSSTKPQ